jgi:2-epi-5-epi-valiolone synthase
MEWRGQSARAVEWTASLVEELLGLSPVECPGLFGDLASRRRFVVIDNNVMQHYGTGILELLARYGIEHNEPLLIPGGEAAKTRATADRIIDAMDEFGVARHGEDIVGWGGGVLHDVLGFAAGEYRRGVAYRMFGTTLVCAIDAMFALKVAINHGWKNRVGLYHPAVAARCDLSWLATLADDDIREGFAEIIKWAVAGDADLFKLVERDGARVAEERFQGRDTTTRAIVASTIGGMMSELSGNAFELESARRSYLGHSWSPGWEPELRHGQAVALDILLTTMIGWRRGLLDMNQRQRIVRAISGVGLALWHSVLEERGLMVQALADTTLHRGQRQRIPVPSAIGNVAFLDDITERDVELGLEDLHRVALP